MNLTMKKIKRANNKKAKIMCEVNIYIYKIITAAAFNYCVQLKHNHVIIVLMNFLLEV